MINLIVDLLIIVIVVMLTIHPIYSIFIEQDDEIMVKSAAATRTHYNMIDSNNIGHDGVVQLIFDTPIFQYEDLILECRYRLNANKKLYSIKWYKDDDEFFQYMPNDNPEVQHYNNRIINTMPEYEIGYNSFRLLLHNVNLMFEGIYSCELSTDAPEFMTFKDNKLLEVYVLPNKSPRISGGNKLNFSLKSRIDLNCTSAKSKPVSLIQWFINDRLAPSDYLIHYNTVNHSDGLQTRTVRLKFIVNEEQYQLGQMKLECVAIYRKFIVGPNGTLIRIESNSISSKKQSDQLLKTIWTTRRRNRLNGSLYATTLSTPTPTSSSLSLTSWYDDDAVYMATILHNYRMILVGLISMAAINISIS